MEKLILDKLEKYDAQQKLLMCQMENLGDLRKSFKKVARTVDHLNATVEGLSETKTTKPIMPKVCHSNAICDGCENIIYGVRYICGYCPDFDLCEKCEMSADVLHSKHVFLKLHHPSQFESHLNSGVLRKKSASILKPSPVVVQNVTPETSPAKPTASGDHVVSDKISHDEVGNVNASPDAMSEQFDEIEADAESTAGSDSTVTTHDSSDSFVRVYHETGDDGNDTVVISPQVSEIESTMKQGLLAEKVAVLNAIPPVESPQRQASISAAPPMVHILPEQIVRACERRESPPEQYLDFPESPICHACERCDSPPKQAPVPAAPPMVHILPEQIVRACERREPAPPARMSNETTKDFEHRMTVLAKQMTNQLITLTNQASSQLANEYQRSDSASTINQSVSSDNGSVSNSSSMVMVESASSTPTSHNASLASPRTCPTPTAKLYPSIGSGDHHHHHRQTAEKLLADQESALVRDSAMENLVKVGYGNRQINATVLSKVGNDFHRALNYFMENGYFA